VKASPKVHDRWAVPIKDLIEREPSFGYRTVAGLLGFNKNTVQRIFQLRGWQVRKRAVGHRPRVQALPSVATRPNERWATDLCRVWAGADGWQTLARGRKLNHQVLAVDRRRQLKRLSYGSFGIAGEKGRNLERDPTINTAG
jgi:hypothetical protein